MRVLYAAVFLDSAAFNLLTAVTPAMLLALGGGNLQSASRSLAQMSALSAAVEFVLNPAFGGLRCSGTLTRAAPSENRAMRCRASRREPRVMRVVRPQRPIWAAALPLALAGRRAAPPRPRGLEAESGGLHGRARHTIAWPRAVPCQRAGTSVR